MIQEKKTVHKSEVNLSLKLGIVLMKVDDGGML